MRTQSGYQFRFRAYAAAHDRTPQDQEEADAHMANFMAWITAKWREWEELTGNAPPHGAPEHSAFDRWLAQQCPSAV